MDEKIEIRRLERSDLNTSAYKQMIQSLFVFGDVDKRLRYAQWIFLENPALKQDEGLPIYMCLVDGKEAGQLAIIPVEIVLSGERIRGGWCVDFFVSPNYQRRGIGKKLLDAAFKDFPVQMTLGQTDVSFELFRSKLNWVYNNNRLTTYKSLLKKSLIIKYLLTKLGLSKGTPGKVDKLDRLDFNSGVSYETVHSFQDCQNILRGQDINSKSVSGILRTIPFLEWRYFKHPYINYTVSKISLADKSCIHIVWRVKQNECWSLAVIVDILYPARVSAESMKSSLEIFKRTITKMGFEMFECQTTDTMVLQGLCDSFVSRRENGQRFLYGMHSMDACPVIENEKWKLYAGDCDVETLDF